MVRQTIWKDQKVQLKSFDLKQNNMQKDVLSLGLMIEIDSELQKTKLYCHILPALQNLKKRFGNIPP